MAARIKDAESQRISRNIVALLALAERSNVRRVTAETDGGAPWLKALPAAPDLSTPAKVYAHYRSLDGEARDAFFTAHSKTLWAHYEAINRPEIN